MESAGPHGCCGKGKKKVSGILEAEKCDGLCHPGLPLNGTVRIKRRIVTVHLNVGFKPTENIQTATQNLVEIADVSIPVHETYGGEQQWRDFLPSLCFPHFLLYFRQLF